MRINSLGYPEFAYLRAFFGIRIARLSDVRKGRDMGASALGVTIITAILVGLAATVLVIIYNIVTMYVTGYAVAASADWTSWP
jgi:hypothetical protein